VDFDINAGGTLNLLEATRKYSPKAVFVQVSTDKVYGVGMQRAPMLEGETMWASLFPYDEHTPIIPPLSPFGVSKLAGDMYAQEYAAQGWLTTGIFRPGCITGRRHEGAEQHGFLAYLVKCIKEGITYNINGYKGKQVRDQIHAFDLVAAFDAFISNPKSGAVYNIGGGYERAVSPLSAGQLVSKRLGKPFKYELLDTPRFGDRQWDIHDVEKFRKDYPEWDYKYDLDAIIDDLCQE
jgi:CDP-paratose 2-epimerase